MASDKPDAQRFSEVNRDHFDSVAVSAYTISWIRDIVKTITGFLQDNVKWLGLEDRNPSTHGVRVLDYACGNGEISLALAPYVSELCGIDVSSKMAEQYNATASKAGLSEKQMHAIQGDMLANPEALGSAELFGFSTIIISMALHHIEDPSKLLSTLAERLAPGGFLIIVDWVSPSESGCGLPDSTHHHPAAHTVKAMGFTRQHILDMFVGAGLADGEVRWYPGRSKLPPEIGGEQQLFFARAKRT